MSLDGVLANPNLVNYLNTLHGKQVLVETKAGQQFVGVFGASSPEMDIGLSFAYMKTTENGQNILPMKDEIKEKMVFKFADVICVSALWNEEKTIKGFATDRDYHAKTNGRVEEDELEEWECEEEGVAIEDHAAAHMPDQRQAYHKSGGWSVHEMFHTNSRLHGVQSTFVEDMSQYTTVNFEGTEEERARAEQIAREIEQNSRSNFYSRLENDDDERDLDKMTTEDELDPSNRKRANKGNFGNNNNIGGRNRNDRGGPTNKRAEGLRGDRKGSGQQQQQPQRYSQGQGYNPRGGPYIPGKRNSTGDDQFGGEWQNPPKDSRPNKEGKVFENTMYKGRMERGGKADRGPASRMEGLKQWGHEFSNAYKQSKSDDVREQQSPGESPHRPQQSSGNAWNNGPPSSLLSAQIASTANSLPSEEVQDGGAVENKDVPEQVSQLNLAEEKDTEAETPEGEKEKSETATAAKKFTFNPNAPAFTPRQQQQQPPTTPTQNMQQIPMGMVAGVPMQGVPGGMMVPAGQPIIGPWPNQNYMQSSPYPMYMPPQPIMSNVQIQGQRGNGTVTQVNNYSNQQNQRRNGPGPQQPMLVNGQWTNQVVVQPMGYFLPPGAGQQGQPFAQNPAIVSQGQQAIPAQMYQQQRYPTMGYMVAQGQPQQQPRYPGNQPGGGGHPDSNGGNQFQAQSSGASTTGQSSQPPTPGPQPPTVASPAQQPPHSATGRGSPAPQPPPAQQFVSQLAPPPSHLVGAHAQPGYFPPHPNVYMYGQTGQPMVVYASTMGHVHPDGQGHPHMEAQPFMGQEQYGQYMQGPTYYPQQQQSMSRQNSLPQNAYNGQPAPGSAPAAVSHPTGVPPPPAPTVASPPQQN